MTAAEPGRPGSPLRRAALRVGLLEKRPPECEIHGAPAVAMIEPGARPYCLRCSVVPRGPDSPDYVRDLRPSDFSFEWRWER